MVSRGSLCLGDSEHNTLHHHSEGQFLRAGWTPAGLIGESCFRQETSYRAHISPKPWVIFNVTPWPLNNTSAREEAAKQKGSVCFHINPGWPGWNVHSFCTPRATIWDLVTNTPREPTWHQSHCEAIVPLCSSAVISNHLPHLLRSRCRLVSTPFQKKSPDGCGKEKRLSCFLTGAEDKNRPKKTFCLKKPRWHHEVWLTRQVLPTVPVGR